MDPGRRTKHPERPANGRFERPTERVADSHLGGVRICRICRIEQQINLAQQVFLDSVCHTPIEKITPLVTHTGRVMPVFKAQIESFLASLSLLDFPTGQIGVNEDVWIGLNQ
jgi:hypothetical protein